MKRPFVMILLLLLRVAVLTMVGLAVLILLFQHRMIYFPRAYSAGDVEYFRLHRFEPVTSEIEGKRQTAWFRPADSARPAEFERLVVVFSGNGSVALDWVSFVLAAKEPRTAWLLFDYPGYGASSGQANPSRILASSKAALAAVTAKAGIEPEALKSKLVFLGHSLGAAAALQLAAHQPVRRLVLIAPFTTMAAMAKRSVGWPLSLLLRHPFDNEARLIEISRHLTPPQVTIFHGERDVAIPSSMGRSLAGVAPEIATFISFPDAGHNDIHGVHEVEILDAVTGP